MFKKTSHCLFVEEETYNWSSPKGNLQKPLIFMAVMFVAAGFLFSVL